MRKAYPLILAMFCGSVCVPAMAQTQAPQAIVESRTKSFNRKKHPNPNSISGFVSDFANDQKAIWTSPLHVSRGDVAWLAPIGAGAATLFAFDHRISNAVASDTSLRTPSNMISDVGLVAPFAVPGAMWLLVRQGLMILTRPKPVAWVWKPQSIPKSSLKY